MHVRTGPDTTASWTAHSYVQLTIARVRLEADVEAVLQAAAVPLSQNGADCPRRGPPAGR